MRFDKRINYYLIEAAIRMNARVDIINETGQLVTSSQVDLLDSVVDENVPQFFIDDINGDSDGDLILVDGNTVKLKDQNYIINLR